MMINPEQRGVSAEVAESEYVLSLKPILRIVWRRSWVVALVTILFAGAAVGYSLLQPPQYQTTSKVLVGQEGGVVRDPSDAAGLQSVTMTMAEAANSRPVAEAAAEQAGLEMSADDVLLGMSAEAVPETQFIEVSYTSSDPETAQEVANALASAFSERISETDPRGNAITATVWAQAATPGDPVSPNPLQNGLVALVLGLVVGMVLVFLLEYLDDSWRSPEEAEEITGVPSFGVVPKFRARSGKKKRSRLVSLGLNDKAQKREKNTGDLSGRLVTVANPDSAAAEAYRGIRTRLLYSRAGPPPQVIPVTGPGAQEGRSTTCGNLAVALALAGKRTLIVDCNLRNPSLHRVFGLNDSQGVVNVLAGENSAQQTWQKTAVPNLELLCGGPVPPNPAELLGSDRFAELLGQARQTFDYVLLDVPSLRKVSDAEVVATQGDGVLLVWDAQKTGREDVRRSMHDLESVGARVIGTVMNKSKASGKSARS